MASERWETGEDRHRDGRRGRRSETGPYKGTGPYDERTEGREGSKGDRLRRGRKGETYETPPSPD